MKTVPLTTYKEGVTTLVLLKTCVDATPQSGLDLPQLRARLKVSDAIEKLEKVNAEAKKGERPEVVELVLEDAVYATAQECIKTTRWLKPETYVDTFAAAFGV